jgi:two-component system sensor histidine kinase DesK
MSFVAPIIKALKSQWLPPQYGKAPYFWMLSFVMLGWKYFYVPFTWVELTLIALSFIFFLPVYLYSFWVHDWRAALCIVFIGSLGIAWAPYNWGSSSFIIFAATMCARFPDKRHTYFGLGGVVLVVALASYVLRLETMFWVPALLFSVPSTFGAIFSETLFRANAKLERNQEENKHLAALAERERIGRDLHDLLGHTLSVITLKAELAGKLFDRDNVACKKEIADIEQTARQALAEVRAAVLGYRNTGLAHELRNAQNTLSSAQVDFISDLIDGSIENLPPAIENVLALALREAVTNIIRHSQATVCEVSLGIQDQNVHFKIADNGSQAALETMKDLRRGNGLTGMNERVHALGGNLELSAQNGVSISITLPLTII